MKKIKKLSKIQLIFLLVFAVLNIYYLLIKKELYESKTSLIVRDLTTSSSPDSLGLSLLGIGSSSSQLQDSMVVEESLTSLDLFLILDEKFHLIQHYKSDALDMIERLPADATIEDALLFFNSRIKIVYDEDSGILHIAFAHVDKAKAKQILEFLVSKVEEGINEFNRRKAKKQLAFVEKEYKKSKKKMENSSQKIEEYQNTHLLLDPSTEATTSSGIISNLEATLTQKQIEYATSKNYLNKDSYELQSLANEIREIKNSIKKQKLELSGSSDKRLNKVLWDYEKLKMQLEFDTEVYKNSVLQLETTKIDVAKSAKTLSIISKPNLPDGYTYPNKLKVFITILILTLLMYGIFSMLNQIIKDHKE